MSEIFKKSAQVKLKLMTLFMPLKNLKIRRIRFLGWITYYTIYELIDKLNNEGALQNR